MKLIKRLLALLKPSNPEPKISYLSGRTTRIGSWEVLEDVLHLNGFQIPIWEYYGYDDNGLGEPVLCKSQFSSNKGVVIGKEMDYPQLYAMKVQSLLTELRDQDMTYLHKKYTVKVENELV